MNNLVLVGRLVKRPVLEETENGRKTTTIVLAVSRNFKNDIGEYETDFIPVNLVGQVAEKISFLSSRPKDYDEENDSQVIVD